MLMLVLDLHASMDPADYCGCGHKWHACAHAQSMVTPGHIHARAQIHESFLREIFFFINSRKFSSSKISRYTVLMNDTEQ
jgi:hypothetical protein